MLKPCVLNEYKLFTKHDFASTTLSGTGISSPVNQLVLNMSPLCAPTHHSLYTALCSLVSSVVFGLSPLSTALTTKTTYIKGSIWK